MFTSVKKLLEEEHGCSSVYGEIMDYDVVGIRGVANVIVEMKLTLNFKVIEQAYRALRDGDYVYIAVPKVKTSHWFPYQEFLKPKGIGLIYVSKNTASHDRWKSRNPEEPYPDYIAQIRHKAKCNPIARKCRVHNQHEKYTLRGHIKAYSHENIGGSKGGETVTDYAFVMRSVKDYLIEHGESTIDEIIQGVPLVSSHYQNPKPSLRATLKEKWNEHWVEMRSDFNKREVYYKVK